MNCIAQGNGAEYHVLADLAYQGIHASLSGHGLRYDIIADVGSRLLRIQVKSTSHLRKNPGAVNCMEYRFRLGKNYTESDFDILALVVPSISTVAYLPNRNLPNSKITLKPAGHIKKHKHNRCIDEFSFNDAVGGL